MQVSKGNRMANTPQESRVVKYQMAEVLKNREALQLVCTSTFYTSRARFHQQDLTAEANKQLGQWPCTYLKVPGALTSPSSKDEDKGMVVLLFITARGNYKHFKKCSV